MKYLVIVGVLFAACTSTRKSVNQQKQEINKSVISFRDSIGRLTVDSTSISRTTGWVASSTDSGYDKVTEEVITETIDSTGLRRETTRTIKEKGQKRTEQLSLTSKYDSAGSMITEHSQLLKLEKEDSAAVVIATQKDVKRTSFMPWWVWLIIAGVAVLAWWKRNPIIDFFT
jgi:hypothetical protein